MSALESELKEVNVDWWGAAGAGMREESSRMTLTMLDKQIKVSSCIVDRSHHVCPAVIAFMCFGQTGG